MSQTIFYQSSMPRAGSTLLQNIIGQNPQFYVTPTSGLIDLILGARIGYNQNNEAKGGDLKMWKTGFYSFCREGVKGYYNSITNKPYILDKSRSWGSYYNLLNEINPNPKILVMVRDLRSIFSSYEKKFRSNPDYDDGLRDNRNLSNITTFQRVQTWSESHPIGQSLFNIYQSILDKTSQNFLFIKYEDLCSNPYGVLRTIYNFLEIEYYEHNFEYISQITKENDIVHGIYGDHIIKNTLISPPLDYNQILGEETCNWVYQNFQWYFDFFNY